ncbi:MAG: hypothetical protein LBE12_02815, partial [Planctomycetaceae bacterium]|nr:hypothetical protein [Planctomycetaceae bacterium]
MKQFNVTIPPLGLEAGTIQRSISGFPSEIFWGDSIFLVIKFKNISNETIKDFTLPDESILNYSGRIFSFLTEGYQEKYYCLPELLNPLVYDKDRLVSPLSPGEIRHGVNAQIEVPPLDDMDNPFWKNIHNCLDKEDVTIILNIECYYSEKETNELKSHIVSKNITIKQRPKNEMTLLRKWKNNIPPNHLPTVDKNRFYKSLYIDPQELSKGNQLVIQKKKYDTLLFLRQCNRKPPADLCPTTSHGWLELEKQFVPSTLRDEIQLTRMLLEYLESKNETQIQKRNELVQWLQSLPEPQRICMASNLEANRFMYKEEMPITKPYLELLKAVYPMMTLYHQ